MKSQRFDFSTLAAMYLIVLVGQASLLCAQQRLQDYLGVQTAGRQGSAIVVNPATGEIRAGWNLRAATEEAFRPGSAAKIVAAAAALEEDVISPRDRIVCRRIPPLLGPAYRCVHPEAPDGFTISSALANSCNYFFTVVSLKLSSDTLFHWYSVLGFGAGTEFDGRATAPGGVRLASGAREKALEAMGERGVVATPAQLLEAYDLIANRGTAWGLWTRGSRRRPLLPSRRITLRNSTYVAITNGLVGCVRSGTCQAARVPGVEVAGKTGTASALDGSGATQAWFVGFAPAERPEIALVVFLERGTGAHDAAPLAGEVLRYYFAAKRKR